MKNLFEAETVEEIKGRLARLQADTPRQWGTMHASQAVEHCARGVELALGDRRPPRKAVSWILGPLLKPVVLGTEQPMRRSTPTVEGLIVEEGGELETCRTRLCNLIDRFAAAGPAGCTSHPHSFFGKLKPQEWAILMYKHLDHHLRQFGV